jgi:tetratricopeptide (TPR) repeat protein
MLTHAASARILLLVVGLLPILPGLALGQSEPRSASYLQALRLVEEGRLRQSEPILKDAVSRDPAQLQREDIDYQRLLNSLGNIYRYAREEERADKLFREAWAIGEGPNPANPSETIRTLSHMSTLYYAMIYNPYRVELFSQRAIIFAKRNVGDEHPGLALPLSVLGEIYSREARCREAKPLLESALKLIDTGDASYHSDRIRIYASQISHLYFCRSIYPDAKTQMEQQLEALEGSHPGVCPPMWRPSITWG